MSQGPLCPNLTQKFQKEVSQIANRNFPLVMLLGGLSVNLNPPKKTGEPIIQCAGCHSTLCRELETCRTRGSTDERLSGHRSKQNKINAHFEKTCFLIRVDVSICKYLCFKWNLFVKLFHVIKKLYSRDNSFVLFNFILKYFFRRIR